MSLLDHPPIYKPFHYPWAFKAWEEQSKVFWLPFSVNMSDDINDYKNNLTDDERKLLTQIFRMFTQSDIEVNGMYSKHYMRLFKPTEILMMMNAFSYMETIHVAAYAHLIDTLGIPEAEYAAFLQYEEMKTKYEHWQEFKPEESPYELAKTLAVFGGFIEGLQLFASFAMLLNFQRFGKMKGMGQIVSWSVRDETMHCLNIIKLYHTLLAENPDIDRKALEADILAHLERIIENEDAFIDLAFGIGEVQGMTKEDVKQYIRFIGDRRLRQLGIEPVFGIKENPLEWLEWELNGQEHANFFEQQPTEYSHDSATGGWDEAEFE